MDAKLGRAEWQVAGQPDELAELDQEFLGRGAHGLLDGHLASPVKVTCCVTYLGHAPHSLRLSPAGGDSQISSKASSSMTT